MKNPTKQTQIYDKAATYGLTVYSTNHQNPGRRYQLGYSNENGGFSPISPNMTAAEALAWFAGYYQGIDRMAREADEKTGDYFFE